MPPKKKRMTPEKQAKLQKGWNDRGCPPCDHKAVKPREICTECGFLRQTGRVKDLIEEDDDAPGHAVED